MCKTLNLRSFSQPLLLFLIQTFLSKNRPYPHYSDFYELHGFRNVRNIFLWNPESQALESRIQLNESGIPKTIGIWNPVCSTDKEF